MTVNVLLFNVAAVREGPAAATAEGFGVARVGAAVIEVFSIQRS